MNKLSLFSRLNNVADPATRSGTLFFPENSLFIHSWKSLYYYLINLVHINFEFLLQQYIVPL